jgi:hypothetical protein
MLSGFYDEFYSIFVINEDAKIKISVSVKIKSTTERKADIYVNKIFS